MWSQKTKDQSECVNIFRYGNMRRSCELQLLVQMYGDGEDARNGAPCVFGSHSQEGVITKRRRKELLEVVLNAYAYTSFCIKVLPAIILI
jgi:hypothetical protein